MGLHVQDQLHASQRPHHVTLSLKLLCKSYQACWPPITADRQVLVWHSDIVLTLASAGCSREAYGIANMARAAEADCIQHAALHSFSCCMQHDCCIGIHDRVKAE